MAAPNTNYSDITVTSYEYRPNAVIDAVSKNNAGFAWMKENGGYKSAQGFKIIEPLQYAENGNGGWYSGADPLPVAPLQFITAAEFAWKQIAVPVVFTGLELDVQNTGDAQVYDLLEEGMKNAERTMANIFSVGFFSDGTGTGGKQLTGLKAMIPKTNTTGTYGGINRATAGNEFWQPKFTDTGADPSSTTIQGYFNSMWYSLTRGGDKPDLILCDSLVMGAYEASLQVLQRFTDGGRAKLGFETLKYKSADVVYDASCTAKYAYFLNTNFMRIRYAPKRNFKPLKARNPHNQDVEVAILAAACNVTCSNSYLLGGFEFAA
jgi:hypothetical protein